MKSKSTATLLAFFLGGLGIHKFYLGKKLQGVLYVLFCWTLIPWIIGVIEAIIYLTISDDTFNLRYNIDNILSTHKEIFKYPELESLELEIQDVLKNGIKKQLDINPDLLTKEKWTYLKEKYPKLSVSSVTNEYHEFYKINSSKFQKYKSKIEAGETLYLRDFEEKTLQAFTDLYLPGIKIKALSPTIIKTQIAGLQYHDYSKKRVKEILYNEPNQFLDLVLDPTNEYDLFAVRIYLDSYFLGYIPREYSSTVHKAISKGEDVTCYLEEYLETGPIVNRIEIEVEIRHNSKKELLSDNTLISSIKEFKSESIKAWQGFSIIATFILKESKYKGHLEALSALSTIETFHEYTLNGMNHYAVNFSLEEEESFRYLLNATTKVRKFTEIEIDGNYFNPTSLNTAFWLISSKSDIEYNDRLESLKKSNTVERIEEALSVVSFLESKK
jgi:TM2 domain-containing membrane protein YozV